MRKTAVLTIALIATNLLVHGASVYTVTPSG